MKRPAIKFSYPYTKLYVVDSCDNLIDATTSSAILLEVLPVKLEALHAPFLAYDTDDGKYKLPKKGDYLLLIFKAVSGAEYPGTIFTTLRRSAPDKLDYYRRCIGKWFDVVINA